MQLKYFHKLIIPFFIFSTLSSAAGKTFLINLRYQPNREFPSLQQKLGGSLGIAPFKDERTGRLYIGHHTSFRRISSYFKSDPFPLEKAFEEFLSNTLSLYEIKTIPISHWDGKPESLKNLVVDSVLMIEIKRFWTEGRAAAFRRTNLNTSIYLTIHLGVKKEGKVFTRNVYVGKEMTVARLTPERAEVTINQILTEIFDNFFSNPYGASST